MKVYFIILMVIFFIGCSQQQRDSITLQKRVDSLEIKLADAYKPGFGEFMSNIQIHHNKLWFAGQGENWKLAEFEVNEIKEILEAVQKYQTERAESKTIGMIYPALDSVSVSIRQKNSIRFKSNYFLLTNTCNACHRSSNFEFNVVKIPDAPPFSNQDFKVK